MSKVSWPLFLLTALSVLVVGCASTSGSETSILITEREQFFELTVPVAKLVIRLPQSGFKSEPPPIASGSTANPRYFLFNDKTRGVMLSGWFEHASRFQGVKDNPPGVLNGQILTHHNVAFIKVGRWDAVSYDVTIGQFTNAELTAHLVQAGSWVELHLSSYPNRSLTEQHVLLNEIVQSIQIAEK